MTFKKQFEHLLQADARQQCRWILAVAGMAGMLAFSGCGGGTIASAAAPPSSQPGSPGAPPPPNPTPPPTTPTPTPTGPGAAAQGVYRTVIDKEVGSVFQTASGFPFTAYGAFVGTPAGTLDPDALRVTLARFDKFKPADDTTPKSFPYTKLRQYEAQEVAAGRAPIFITATYQGKKRQVYFSWSLKLVNNAPTAPSQNWEAAVNVKDDRFIHFWIQQYIRPILWQPLYSTPNQWFELDEGAYNWGIFGVLDDSNHFVASIPWDAPFPTDEAGYLDSVATFFSRLKELAPDIRTMPNIGTMSDPTHFPAIFANVPGIINENIYGWGPVPTTYTRNNWFRQNLTYIPQFAAQGGVGIMRAVLPGGDSNALVSSFVMYSLLKGPNFFFAPGGTAGAANIPPSQWAGMKAVLGNPVAPMQSGSPTSKGAGFRLYSREFEGGKVYLNWTGVTQVINLDSSKKFFDPAGHAVTQVQLADSRATYVTTTPQALTAPRIAGRFGASISGAQTITLQSDVAGGNIRYTLDGSAPTVSSSLYSGPLQISDGSVLRAADFNSSGANSWSSDASYDVASGLPTVGFTSSGDSGPAGTYYPVLSLSSIPENVVSVNYRIVQSSGTTTGSATFLKGEVYRYFAVPITGIRGSVATITITDSSGANLGSALTLIYTIQ